jgi:hypothetical protein
MEDNGSKFNIIILRTGNGYIKLDEISSRGVRQKLKKTAISMQQVH